MLSETSLSYEGIRDLLIRQQTLGVGSAELGENSGIIQGNV